MSTMNRDGRPDRGAAARMVALACVLGLVAVLCGCAAKPAGQQAASAATKDE